MEKLKNTPLYIKTLVLLSALLWGGSVMGQPLFNEAFDSSDGTTSGTNWSSGDNVNATVQSGVFQLTAPSDNYSRVIWSSSVFEQVCTTDFFIKGDVVYSGSGSGSVVLEYSTDGSSWQEVDANGISEPQVQLQLRVDNISRGETVTLDNVKVYQEFSATVVSVKNCCNGLKDGEITVSACGGEDLYTYLWTGPDEYTGADKTITGLQQGDYTVVVTKTNSSAKDTLGPITIGEYSDVDVVYTVQDWSCNSLVGCNGSISLEISGGTPTYTINYSDGTTSETHTTTENHSFTDLCAGTYTINVTDANDCVSTSGEQTITIVEDTQAPTGCVEPEDYTMLLSDYLALDSTYVLIDESTVSITYNSVPGDPDTIIYEYDASGYNKMYFDFEVTQGGSSWNGNDVISFYVDYNEDDPINGELLYESIGEYQVPNIEPNIDSLRLPALADGVGTLYLYIVYKAGSGNSYSITDITLSGNSMTSTIAANSSGAGAPTECTDIYSNAIITHSDGPINWVCNVEGNQEFWFNRTFKVTDECLNDVEYTQKIGVGEKPIIDAPRDTILDYCHYANVGIPVPGYTDNSTGCEKTVDFKYVLRDETDNDSISGGTIPEDSTSTTITFPKSEANDTTFVITWIATDEAGLQNSIKQNVTILKPITITLTPNKTNFCSGEEVSFEFTIEGGTGSYETILDADITPSETLSGNGNSYTYTTSSLVLNGTKNITINVTDTNVSNYGTGNYEVIGGCDEQIIFKNGDDFTIHQNISTNALERVD